MAYRHYFNEIQLIWNIDNFINKTQTKNLKRIWQDLFRQTFSINLWYRFHHPRKITTVKNELLPRWARLWGRGINSNQTFFKINSDYIYSKCFIFHDKVQFYSFPVIIWPQNWSFYIKYFTYRRIGSGILPPTGEHLVHWSRKENMFFTIIFFADSYF